MFNCPECKKTSQSGEQGELIVVARHLHTFPARQQVHRFKQTETITKRGKPLRKEGRIAYRDDPGGKGYQIDKEVRVCKICAPKIKASLK